MKTVEVTVYTVDELLEQYPTAFEKAHDGYIEDSPWFVEFINEALQSVEDAEESPLAGRFIEWDVYRNYAHYTDGPIKHDEGVRLLTKFPRLYGASLWIAEGRLAGDTEYADEPSEAEAELVKAEAWLADLHGKLSDAMQMEWEYLTSYEYFIEDCKANEWTFEANGDMRNV